jgi:sigma-B regulation protein RsbU (phosphoserine phosphatase)
LIVGSAAFYFILVVQYYYIRQSHYEHELNIAADIQKKLFPQKFPQDTGIQIAAVNVMAESVGGDYYDLITNDKKQLALVVGDSMGKGISSALIMTAVRAVWQSWVSIGSKSPSETLSMVNRSVYVDLRAAGAFVTMFSALYDPATSIFQYSNAGHNPPIFRPALLPKCKNLDVGGLPVGIFQNLEFKSDEFHIQDGDVIIIYTDGIVEATDKVISCSR